MAELLAIVLVVGVLAAILGSLAWLAARVRRRGVGDNVMGPFEEIWHPAAHRFRAEIQVYEERTVPLPPAEGPDRQDRKPARSRPAAALEEFACRPVTAES